VKRRAQFALAGLLDFAEELETHVNVFGTHPFDGKWTAALAERRERIPEPAPDRVGKIQGDEGSNRLPRR
jgi:hypothetical protein